jgi:hypothetical protein
MLLRAAAVRVVVKVLVEGRLQLLACSMQQRLHGKSVNNYATTAYKQLVYKVLYSAEAVNTYCFFACCLARHDECTCNVSVLDEAFTIWPAVQ